MGASDRGDGGAPPKPIQQVQEAVATAGLLAPILRYVRDGDFHVFVLKPGDDEAWAKVRAIEEATVADALSVGGTCTGEHGIDIGKREALVTEHGAEAVALMPWLKDTLDPRGLFNPLKLFNAAAPR